MRERTPKIPSISKNAMQITVHFWSYFADIAGARSIILELPATSTVRDAMALVHQHFPTLASARNSTLIAVGLDYASLEQPLKAQDEVSLFPPVQGG